MSSLRLPRRLRVLAAALLAAIVPPSALAGAANPERGFPLIQAYEPALQKAASQSYGMASDPRGILYFANAAGALIYDGAWWRLIPIGSKASAFAIAADAKGQVAVGGVDDLGLLAPDARGTLRFVSLLDRLPPGQRRFGQVFSIRAVSEGFAFMTQQRLLLWDGARLATVATFPGDRPYAASFAVYDTLYVWTREGLRRLAGGRLQPVPGGELFRGRRIDQILPADPDLLVSVRGEGLFLFRDGQAAPFAPAASRWTAEKKIYDGRRLPDGRWAFGSITGGLLLLRPDGTIDQVIDSRLGLPDDFVTGLAVDREGSLWLALNTGVVRVEIASPVSVIDGRTGLQGSVYSLARHRGQLWVGTAAGVFTTAAAGGDTAGPPLRLRAGPALPPGVWSLLSVDGDLLAGTAYGLYEIGGSAARKIGTAQSTVYTLVRSTSDPDRVWVGMEDGLAAVRHEAGGWRWEGKLPRVASDVRSIVEERGTVWCGTADDVVGLRLPPGSGARRASPVAGNVFRIAGRILVADASGIRRLDEAAGKLVEDPALAAFQHRDAFHLAEDAAGNLWMDSSPISVGVRHGDRWLPEPLTLPELPARELGLLLAEPDGVVWLTAGTRLFRYEGAALGRTASLPASPLLGRLTEGGRLLFGGAPGTLPGSLELPYNARRLRIEFAPLSFRAGLRYQTRLEPLDAGWSAPAAEPFAELARVPPGDYSFHVRMVGAGGETGPETAWPFRVRPPWYASLWAITLWLALALLGVRGYAQLRGRALHQRAARLEARVSEQTVELRSTVEELRRAHADLAAANARLEELSLRDELTGIANRRRLHLALEEEWGHTRQSIAFILLDLDSFKLLNDTRGHLAGDLCLQAVAGLLAEEARRQRGLAARYGGEELAVLLPGIGLAAALDIAERLRQGIEELAIPHPSAPLGRVTASFGVAAFAPVPGQRAEDLIEAADMALYRAKAEGKNRVNAGGVRSRTAPETSESPAA